MKNIWAYYLAITLPILLLVWLSISKLLLLFGILLVIYSLPYRLMIDGLRLESKGLIKRKEYWKLLIPGNRLEYTKELYFKK